MRGYAEIIFDFVGVDIMLLSRFFGWNKYFLIGSAGRYAALGRGGSRLVSLVTVSLGLILVMVSPSLAAPDELIGTFDQWSAHHYTESGKTVCYAVSSPIDSKGKYKKRGKIYAFVTRRSGTNNPGEFNIATGYTFKNGSTPRAQIGGQRFNLIIGKDRAWASDGVADKKLILAMKRGLKMIVKGVSSRGTQTTDTYSLVGFTSAYKAMSQKCGFKK